MLALKTDTAWKHAVFILFVLCSGCARDTVDDISIKKLAEFPAKDPIVVVNFWATWCPPCLTEIPFLNRMHQERTDVKIYGISLDDPALGREVYDFVERYRIRYPVYMRERLKDDQKQSEEWYHHTEGIPVTFIFKDGKLHNTIYGAIERQNELADAIDGPSYEEQYSDTDDSIEATEYEEDEYEE